MIFFKLFQMTTVVIFFVEGGESNPGSRNGHFVNLLRFFAANDRFPKRPNPSISPADITAGRAVTY